MRGTGSANRISLPLSIRRSSAIPTYRIGLERDFPAGLDDLRIPLPLTFFAIPLHFITWRAVLRHPYTQDDSEKPSHIRVLYSADIMAPRLLLNPSRRTRIICRGKVK
jgi:hypothetical protein